MDNYLFEVKNKKTNKRVTVFGVKNDAFLVWDGEKFTWKDMTGFEPLWKLLIYPYEHTS